MIHNDAQRIKQIVQKNTISDARYELVFKYRELLRVHHEMCVLYWHKKYHAPHLKENTYRRATSRLYWVSSCDN